MRVDPFAVSEKNGIRYFTDSGLDEAIKAAISRKNPEKDLIVMGHVEGKKLYCSALYKLGDDFSIVAAAYKSKDVPMGWKNWDFGAEFIWEPF